MYFVINASVIMCKRGINRDVEVGETKTQGQNRDLNKNNKIGSLIFKTLESVNFLADSH